MSASSPISRSRSARTWSSASIWCARSMRWPITKERLIFLRADRAVPYGELMDVLEMLRAGGIHENQAGGARGRSGRPPFRPRLTQSPDQSEIIAEAVPPSLALSAAAALAIHLGCVALAVVHMQTDEADDVSARRRSRSDSKCPRVAVRRPTFRRGRTPMHPSPRPRLPSRRPRRKPICPRTRRRRPPKPTGSSPRTSQKSRSRTTPKKAAMQTTASRSRRPLKRPRCRVRAIPEGQRSVAPAIGTGESARRISATWQKELVAHLDKHKRYPTEHQKNCRDLVTSCSIASAMSCRPHRKGIG